MIIDRSLKIIILFLSFFHNATIAKVILAETPTVSISTGLIRGKLLKNRTTPYYAFKGIPYAEPPINNLRFEAPVEKKSWSNVFDAFEHGNRCPSPNGIYETTASGGSEDCLYLNVYTPSIKKLTKYSVMFFIHPSLFTSESSDLDQFSPDYLIGYDVVVVTINYRHSVFGFLSSGDEYASGNQGLKDIVMALQWVNKNIRVFRGDPKKVTIFGQSNGAALVNYLMLSDMSKGLFTKVIMQSGSALVPWYFQTDPRAHSERLGRRLGLTFNSTKELIDKLKTVEANEIMKALTPLTEMDTPLFLRSVDFAPCVESVYSKYPFLTESPVDRLIKSNFHEVTMMIGTSNNEGMFLKDILSKLSTAYNENPQNLIPLSFELSDDSPYIDSTVKELQKIYFNGRSNGTADEWLQVYTDMAFKFPIDRIVRFYVRKCYLPIHYYEFSYDGSLNYYKKRFNLSDTGATHTDEIFYIFNTNSPYSVSSDSNSVLMRERIISLWTSFAKNGNPTLRRSTLVNLIWNQYRINRKNYYGIDRQLSNRQKPARMDALSSLQVKLTGHL